jgi:hypothetical protein
MNDLLSQQTLVAKSEAMLIPSPKQLAEDLSYLQLLNTVCASFTPLLGIFCVMCTLVSADQFK